MKRSLPAYLLRLSAGGLLLFLALFTAIFAPASAFSLSLDQGRALLLCLGSALGVSAVFSLPPSRLRLLLAGLGLGALLLCLWRQFDQILPGGQAVFHQISLRFHQALPAVPYYELPQAMTEAGMAQAVDRLLTLLIPLLGLWMGLWMLGQGIFWPAVLLPAATGGMGLFIMLEPHPLCLLAFALFLGLALLTRGSYRRDATLGSRRVWTTLLPLCLVLALLGGLFPGADYVRDPRLEALRQKVMYRAQQGMELPEGPAFGHFGDALTGAQSFAQAGPLRFDGHTVLTLRANSPQSRILLRGFSSARYTAGGWRPLEREDYDPLSQFPQDSLPWHYPALALGRPYALPTDKEIYSLRASSSLSVTDLDTGTGYLYTPYYPADIPAGSSFFTDAFFARGEDRQYAFSYYPDLDVDDSFTLSPDSEAAQWQALYREWVYQHYLELPRELLSSQALEQIALFADAYASNREELTQPAGQSLRLGHDAAVAAAGAVGRYLASFTTYDQETPLTPDGEDFVSYFLTESHRGYCLHYASAAVLFLRAMGIPARFAAGYVASVPAGDAPVSVPDRNAHAWVEVYCDDFGWAPVDVTPGFSGTLAPAAAASPSAAPSSTPSRSPRPSPSPSLAPSSPSPSPSAAPTRPGQAAPTHRLWDAALAILPVLLSVLLPLLALAAALLLQRRLRLGARRRRCTDPSSNRAVLALYHYLASLERHAGIPAPPQALALAQRAAFSRHVLTREERWHMEFWAAQAAWEARRAPLPRRLLLRWLWALI